MANGWIKLHRIILEDDELFGTSLTFAIFVCLLLMADENGRVITGRFTLARMFRSKPSTIYKTLKRLESNNKVTLQSNNQYTVISILKWAKYQDKVTTDFSTKEQQSNTTKEIRIKNLYKKEINKEKEIKKYKNLKSLDDIKALLANKFSL